MPAPRRKTRRDRKAAVHPWVRARENQPYAYKDNRPAPHHTYLLDGTVHRYDGKCHSDCENVR